MVRKNRAGHNDRLVLVAALDVDGVTIEGMLFRATAMKDRPEAALTFQLEYRLPPRRDDAIERIDWRPLHTHTNNGRGPPEHRYTIQHGSHHHPFHLNWLPEENRMRTTNLPIAVPIVPDIPDFPSLLEFGRKCLRIGNLMALPAPPWEGRLL